MNTCELVVDGKAWGGWTSIQIQRGLEQIAGCFALELTQLRGGTESLLSIREGLPCEVRLSNDTVITGYIDLFESDLADTSYTIRVEGRDKAGDLVDCSALYKTGQWRNVSLEQIVRDIARPFGIDVTVATNTGEKFTQFALEDGETAFAAIDRAARLRSVLVTSTPQGDLVLTMASDTRSDVELREGMNIKRISATHSWKDRHSEIILKAQVPGNDYVHGAHAAHLKASSKDQEITRYRPLVVMSEHGTEGKNLADRARWEHLVRMGRGKRGKCTVVGWRMGRDGQEGGLWQPNTLVQVDSPSMALQREVLIVACTYTLDASGTRTDLEFTLPEAYNLVGASGKKTRRNKGGGFAQPWEIPEEKNERS